MIYKKGMFSDGLKNDEKNINLLIFLSDDVDVVSQNGDYLFILDHAYSQRCLYAFM